MAVTSSSMEHRPTTDNGAPSMCGHQLELTRTMRLSEWWSYCGDWYEENTNITIQDFQDFPLSNGFNKGDIILLRGPRDLDIGDIIVFQSGKEHPIIHRVVDINDKITTKGDNNPGLIRDSELDEENIPEQAIIGKAYARIPYLGYIKIWFTQFIELFTN